MRHIALLPLWREREGLSVSGACGLPLIARQYAQVEIKRGLYCPRLPAVRLPTVRFGSWLCENAKTLNRDRRSYSSKTVLVAQRASGFNLEIELKNIILRRVSNFEFLHSQGQTQKSGRATGKSALPPRAASRKSNNMSAFHSEANVDRNISHVRKVPSSDIHRLHSITLSARAANVGGTVRPSGLATFCIDHEFVFRQAFCRRFMDLSCIPCQKTAS